MRTLKYISTLTSTVLLGLIWFYNGEYPKVYYKEFNSCLMHFAKKKIFSNYIEIFKWNKLFIAELTSLLLKLIPPKLARDHKIFYFLIGRVLLKTKVLIISIIKNITVQILLKKKYFFSLVGLKMKVFDFFTLKIEVFFYF